MKIERKLHQLGIELPDFGPKTYYGANYGKMKPFHRIGNLLVLVRARPDLPDGSQMFPSDRSRSHGRAGLCRGASDRDQLPCQDQTGDRDLDRMVALVRTLNFVVCAPGFTDPNLCRAV